MPTSRVCNSNRAAAASPPTCACRSRGSPNASPRPFATPSNLSCPRRSSATSATETFIARFWPTPSKPEELAEAERLNKLIVTRALAMDGTCTGEHGVGMHKMDFLREEHGDDALELMARIKRSFDPLDILNPGKVVRVEVGCGEITLGGRQRQSKRGALRVAQPAEQFGCVVVSLLDDLVKARPLKQSHPLQRRTEIQIGQLTQLLLARCAVQNGDVQQVRH